MAGWSKMVSMKEDAADRDEMIPMATLPQAPDYPWGLRIRLTHKELAKLGLEADCDIGDLVDMRCMGEVTSVSKNETDGVASACVEIQIMNMAIESEADEPTPGDDE